MKLLCVSLFLAVALSYASGCGRYRRSYEEKSFEKGIYVTARVKSSAAAMMAFLKYTRKANDQKVYIKLGPLITQIEKSCEKNNYQSKLVFSRKLPDMYLNNPPMPTSDLLKIDYQLGSSNVFYTKKIITFVPWMISFQLSQFMRELKCDKKSFQENWFYMVYRWAIPIGLGEVWIRKSSGYVHRSNKRCAPDDSNIEELCKGESGYSCPNMTFGERNGISARNISMYLVTGTPTSGVNCSFDSARFIQYMGNHYYFMGNNTQSKKMQRTVPVMTKALRVSSQEEDCKKKYQMQFYVNTEHLNTNDLPCPTQPGVMLQKVHMQIYVKTFNGNPDTDMSQVKDLFTDELNEKEMTYNHNAHYISQYRGHGPMFGRTMEIWIEKFAPEYETVCHGTPKTTLATEPTTATRPTTTTESLPTTPIISIIEATTGSGLISYY